MYDIDAFDASASMVSALHVKGFIVIAYSSFGTYENWRTDATSFPPSVNDCSNGWTGAKLAGHQKGCGENDHGCPSRPDKIQRLYDIK
jgi:hypothetical protein